MSWKGWLIVFFIVLFMVEQPQTAEHLVQQVFSSLGVLLKGI